MRPRSATRSAAPSGSGVAPTAADMAVTSASRARRATSDLARAVEDRGHGVDGLHRLASPPDDAHPPADRGAEPEQSGDAAGVRAPAVRFEGHARIELARTRDDRGRRTRVQAGRIVDHKIAPESVG